MAAGKRDWKFRGVDARARDGNAFFLPVGTMEDLDDVRQYANERGFDFDTITDMLDALDVSVSYGKPFYGTASAADESWAMSDRLAKGTPLFSSANFHDLRRDKTAWLEAGGGMAGAAEIVATYYRPAAYAEIPPDAVLVPMPSTSGLNILPDALANRIAEDFGQTLMLGQVAVAAAEREAKTKSTFFAKMADPVTYLPIPEKVAELRAAGRPVMITEDLHNTGESWIAFARLLQSEGIPVLGVATLVSTEQRKTSPRDIERLAEKLRRQPESRLTRWPR